ncbi:hypothetical protein [Streptomyces hydrogenans]|uniref:hypothetical protein n=1 Tax=Streptomyces hydrogenans TaxID=1873719 RepID=UPI0033A1ACC5
MGGWAAGGAEVLGRVRVTVRVTFAGHEAVGRHDPEDVDEPVPEECPAAGGGRAVPVS